MGVKIRTVSLGFAVMLGAGAVLAGPAGAMAPVAGTGSVTCNVIATIKFSPPLKTGGTLPTKTTLKSALTGCSGTGDGAHIVSGKSTVVTTADNNDCIARLTSTGPSTPGDVKWKVQAHTSKLINSTVQFTSSSTDLGPPIVQTAAGTSIAGSFNGEVANSRSVLQESSDDLTAACGSKKGLKIIHIISGSTFSLGSAPS